MLDIIPLGILLILGLYRSTRSPIRGHMTRARPRYEGEDWESWEWFPDVPRARAKYRR
jgi:hypothetical protein